MLFEKIKNDENLIVNCIRELKESHLPLFILGGAALGKRVLDLFGEKGIKVDKVVVDDKYFIPGKTLEGFPIESMEDSINKVDKCNIVIAFDGYVDGALDVYKSHINKLYVLDFIGTMALDKWSAIEYDHLEKMRNQIEWLESKLQDDKSLEHLAAFINQRIIGNYAKDVYDAGQYFDDMIIDLSNQEVFVDCGAYTGDSIEAFLQALGNKGIKEYNKIFAFEADKGTVKTLTLNTQNLDNLIIYDKGVSDKNEMLKFNSGLGSSAAFVSDGNDYIETVKLDTVLENEAVTFVKMDIEGFELQALKGMENIIKTQKPKLAICVYHKPYDFIEIAQYIMSLVPEYKLYIRNYNSAGIETVLYAVL